MTRFEREIREQPEVLQAILDDPAPAEVGAALRDAPIDLVITLARGSSDNAVTFFGYLLGLHLGVPLASMPPSLPTLYGADMRAGRALVIGVSQSGESRDVVAALRAVAGGAVPSVALTNAPGSALEGAARWPLRQGAGEERAVAASKTFSSQMMVLARLVAEWSADDSLRAALRRVPELLREMLAASEALERAAWRLTHAEQLDVLGRGLSYGPALEAALKLKETSYLHAHAYSSAEFQHGPIASLSAGDPVLLLALSDASLEPNREVARRLLDAGADLTVVSSDPELLEDAAAPVPLPADLPPVTEAFAHVLAGQWMALHLARQRRLDPDTPRHLNKVTQTR